MSRTRNKIVLRKQFAREFPAPRFFQRGFCHGKEERAPFELGVKTELGADGAIPQPASQGASPLQPASSRAGIHDLIAQTLAAPLPALRPDSCFTQRRNPWKRSIAGVAWSCWRSSPRSFEKKTIRFPNIRRRGSAGLFFKKRAWRVAPRERGGGEHESRRIFSSAA